MRKAHRNRLVLAAATILAVGSIVAIAPWSSASHSGTAGVLTSSNGGAAILFDGADSLLTGTVTVTGAQWSPDGSRAVFLDATEGIRTVRFDDGLDATTLLAEPAADTRRGSPTWLGAGYGVVWSEQSGPGQPWHLWFVPSATGGLPEVVAEQQEGFHYTEPDGGAGSALVLQRQAQVGGAGTGTPQIWRYDALAPSGSRFALVVGNGRDPALSPDGTMVAFIRSEGGNDEIFVADLDGSPVVQVTNTGTDKDNPVWSHDGTTLAFTDGGSDVATVPADAVHASAVTTVAGLNGVPAYQAHRANPVLRLAGATDRFGTAAKVSQFVWATEGAAGDQRLPARAVVIARSDTFPDGLGGAALAAAKQGPLLLTRSTVLHSATRAEMIRVLGDNPTATVYVLGGTGAVSQGVQNQIADLGYRVVRLAGLDRYATAIAIAKAITPKPSVVLAATGQNFPDALGAAAVAGAYNARGVPTVVILTNNTALPSSVSTYLNGLDQSSTVMFGIGGHAATAMAPYGAVPVAASDRYGTSAATAARFFQGEVAAGLATGLNWPDALTGGAAMGVLGGPLLITPGTTGVLPASIRAQLDVKCGSVDTGLVFGGAAVVSDADATAMGTVIGGPGRFTFSSGAASVRAMVSQPLR